MGTNRPSVLDQTEAIVGLPDFMSSIEAWRHGASGNWAHDNALGRERADALRANLIMTGNYPALLRLVKTLADDGSFEAVEVGFFQRIGEFLAR